MNIQSIVEEIFAFLNPSENKRDLNRVDKDPYARIQTLPVMKPGEKTDVIARRPDPSSFFYVEINVPTTAFYDQDPNGDFTWGYVGSGPHRFAYCILLHFTDGDETFASTHESEFVVDFLLLLPKEGGIIEAPKITQ